MMLWDEIKTIKSGKKELRSFGYLFAVVFALIYAYCWWRHEVRPIILLGISLVFLLLGLWIPLALKPIHKVWMTLALMIGSVVTRILLTLLFYIVVTPIGLFCRLLGKKFLDLRFRDGKVSYWIVRKQSGLDKKSYELQY